MKSYRLFCFICALLLFFVEDGFCQNKKDITLKNGISLVLKKKLGLWGVYNKKGDELLPCIYKEIKTEDEFDLTPEDEWLICVLSDDEGGYSEVYSCEGYKVIDANDKRGVLYFMKIDGQWYITDSKNSTILDGEGKVLYKYKKIRDEQGFYSLINEVADTTVVDAGQYTNILLLNGLLRTNVGTKEGYLKMDGSTIIPANLYRHVSTRTIGKELRGFCVGLSSDQGFVGYIDYNSRKLIFPAGSFTNIYPLKNGLYEVKRGGAGIADADGNVLFMTDYNSLSPFQAENGEWMYATYRGNGKGVIGSDGRIITEPVSTTERKLVKEEHFRYIKVRGEDGKFGAENTSKKTIIPTQYDMVLYRPKENLFYVEKDGSTGLIGVDGNIIIPCGLYDYIGPAHNSYYCVERLGRTGLCDSSGKELIPPLFDELSPRDSYVLAHNGLYEGVLSYSGEVIVPLDYTFVYKESDRLFKVRMFDKNGFYSTEHKLVVPPKYTYARHVKTPIEYYLVYDGDSRGCFSEDGRMLLPTGLFNNISIITSNEPGYDYLVEAYNSSKERYYFDLQGNIVKSVDYDKEYNTLFHEAGIQYDSKNYSRALDLYNKALSYKKTTVAYFNLGATYYNLGNYKLAIESFTKCRDNTSSANLKSRSNEMIADCQEHLKPKKVKKQKSTFWMELALGVLDVASASLSAYNAMTSYNVSVPTYYTPSIDFYTYTPPITHQIDFPKVQQTDWAEYFKKDKEKFINNYRSRIQATEGRTPTKEEEELAYTQDLQARNAAMSNNYNTQWNSSSSYNYDSGSSSSFSTSSSSTTSSKPARRCGLCGGTGTTVESVATFGIVEKEYCSTCGKTVYSGHYHQICKLCHGTGSER